MELYCILLLYFIDHYHLPSKHLLALLSPLGQKYAILGIPAQRKNLYRSLYRLEAAGYIQLVDADSPERKYTTTSRGKALLADYATIHESLFHWSKGDLALSSAPSPPSIAKPDRSHPTPDEIDAQDTFDPVQEILVDYIPAKAHAKISSFYAWCQKTPKLTADTLHTKLITMFWGDDQMVPKSMTAKFPELIDRLLAVI